MTTWDELYPRLATGVGHQGYRPIAATTLPESTVTWSTGDSTLDSALVGVLQTPNWNEIGRQLRSVTTVPGFAQMFVRRDRHYLNLVFAQALSDQPLTRDEIDRQLAVVWEDVRQLARLVDQFQPSPESEQKAKAALDSLINPPAGGTKDQAVAVAAAALQFGLDLWNVDSAQAIHIFIATNGLAPDAIAQLESLGGMRREDTTGWTFHAANIYAVGIDLPHLGDRSQARGVHGHVPSEFNVGAFAAAIA